MTKGGETIKEITMYDFRHASACYWLPRYKSESALKYRFGWKKSSMIHHYSKLLGMRDTIQEEDLMLNDEVKTMLERDLESEKNARMLLSEEVEALRNQLTRINTFMDDLTKKSPGVLKYLAKEAKEHGIEPK